MSENLAPWIAVAAFVFAYIGMALGRLPGLAVDRTGMALVAAVAVVAAGALPLSAIGPAIDFPTLAILFGLMFVSAQFQVGGAYDWCAARIAGAAAGPGALLGLVVLAGGVLSALLTNDVVVFAMTPMLCAGLLARGLDPKPYLIALAGAANAGSAATLIGNPQNLVIGEVGGLHFGAFVVACAPPALIAMVIVWLTVRIVCARQLVQVPRPAAAPPPAFDRGLTIKGAVAVAVLVALYLSGAPRDLSTLAVAALLLLSRRVATRQVLGQVDWALILLFACLFVVNAAFAATPWPGQAVAWLGDRGLVPDRLAVLAPLALVASNTIGNVPAVVLILSLWPDLGAPALQALAVLSTLAGNLLIVGSLANIITVQRAADQGVHLGFAEHARAGVPMTLASMAAALLWLWVAGGLRW